jgi:hypothetical protein
MLVVNFISLQNHKINLRSYLKIWVNSLVILRQFYFSILLRKKMLLILLNMVSKGLKFINSIFLI